MEDKVKLTQAEQLRISDLTNEILKNQDAPQKYNEIVSKIRVFVEGVKLGLTMDSFNNCSSQN